jgi:hypothetical protein
VAIDGKGDEDFAAGIIALNLTARPDAAASACSPPPYDLWRWSPAELVGRLMGAWPFIQEAEFYANIAQLTLRLATSAPGHPPIRSVAQLVERLDPAWLSRSWDGHPAELGIIRDLKGRLPMWSCGWGTWPPPWAGRSRLMSGRARRPGRVHGLDAGQCLGWGCLQRMLLGDLSHYAVRRKPRQRRALVLFDEFSSWRGHRTAVNLIDRARGPMAGWCRAGSPRCRWAMRTDASASWPAPTDPPFRTPTRRP